ncbi:MAG: CCA tRNA nucleotidyltransferase [Clostridia bacterium]|nr:CCA tRNA nucleotidyltransferase [Clostridia bacterium]
MVIPENILYALSGLTKKGFEAYLVGGCVRDMIMGKTPSDFDITTNALPEEIINCFHDKKCVLSGMKHGTVAPIINGEAIEITTYRIDGEYRDSRHPEEVYFTKKLEEDLSRRDFTVNAMAMDENFNITDPFSGKADIEKGIIRCVGDAEKRFTEDSLRIMRALRFSSVLGFSIEEETKKGILNLFPLLSNIARERIFTELKKLLAGINAPFVLSEFKDVFLFIMPSLSKVKYYDNVKRIKGCETALSFALLFDGISEEDARDALNYLKTDRLLKDNVIRLMEDKNVDFSDIIKMRYFLKTRKYEDVSRLISFKEALELITENETREARALLEKASSSCTKIKELAISGSDLLSIGISGRKTGIVLDALLNLVIEEKCENDKASLINAAKSIEDRH